MLVFTVRTDEEVVIHQDGRELCRVVMVQSGENCRLGFKADRSIQIDRLHIYRAKKSATVENTQKPNIQKQQP